MAFESKTYAVNVDGIASATERALWIEDHVMVATEVIGKKPTHVLAAKALRLDIDTLYGLGLRVKRIRWPVHYEVRLAVELPGPALRSAGGPRRISVQARLM